ncbi:MAG: sulfotransferase family 2 domain-containing protein [Acidimicrobiales bacterium]
MPYSIPLRCLFIHVPKNAGTSVMEALRLDVGLPGHRTWREYEGRCITPEGTPYFSFAVVRDPRDRVVSSYDYARMERSLYHAVDGVSFSGVHPDHAALAAMTLDECVAALAERPCDFDHPGWGPQHPYVLDEHGEARVDMLCRFEHLAADLERVTDRLGIAQLELPHLNRSTPLDDRPAPWEQRLGARSRALVEQHYARDLDLFGYRPGVDQRAVLDALCARRG